MPVWTMQAADLMWRNALGAVPLAIMAGAACRLLPLRPATRHLIWLVVLLRFVCPFLTSPLERGSDRPADTYAAAPAPKLPMGTVGRGSFLEAAPRVSDPEDRAGAVSTGWDEHSVVEGEPHLEGGGLDPASEGTWESSAPVITQTLADVLRLMQPWGVALGESAPAGPCASNPLASTPEPGGGDLFSEAASYTEPHAFAHLPIEQPSVFAVFDTGSGEPSEFAGVFVPDVAPSPRDLAGASRPAAAGALIPIPSGQQTTPSPAVEPVISRRAEPRSGPVRGPEITRGSTSERANPEDSPALTSTKSPTFSLHASPDISTAVVDPESRGPDGAVANLRAWTESCAGLLGVARERLYGLPALPWPVWGIGTALLILATFLRGLWGASLIRSSSSAPAGVQARVARSAGQLGLRACPAVRFVSHAVSPMIVCRRSPVLVLPMALWKDLDDEGRQAVIFHELAHLKRRDHWVLWLESLVSWVFWWNPVVWWARRRLREEADLCCDAWVTWLMPQGRRVYAETLLATRRLLNDSECVTPGSGMAMLSGRASRMARRIKMIMLEPARPRLSGPGVALGLVMALCAWMASPASSCPPGEKEKACAPASAPAAPSALTVATPSSQAPVATALFASDPVVRVAPHPPALPAQPSRLYAETLMPHPPAGATTAPTPMVYVSAPAPDDSRLEERLRRLEEQMERLHEQLARLNDGRDLKDQVTAKFLLDAVKAADVPSAHAHVAEALEHAAKTAHGATVLSGEAAQAAVRDALRRSQEEAVAARGAAAAARDEAVAAGEAARAQVEALRGLGYAATAAPDGAIIVRSYKLSGEKLEALVKLMIRDDVPVRVRNAGDAIEVHATEQQHAVFALFVSMISEEGEQDREYRLPGGKLEALTEFMSRSDVPVMVSPGSEQITVHGSELQQRVFSAFVNLIHPAASRRGADASGGGAGGGSGGAVGVGVAQPSLLKGSARGEAGGRNQAPRASRQAEEETKVAEETGRMERIQREATEEMERIEAERNEVEARMKELQQRARELDREARGLDRQSEELRREAEHQRTLAERLESQDRRAALDEARRLDAEADELTEQVAELEQESEELEKEAEQLEPEVLAMRERSRAQKETLRSAR